MAKEKEGFGFGIEAEFLLCDKTTYAPLSHVNLNHDKLLAIVDSIDVSDFSTEGFNVKPLHNKATPYLIEGYYLTDEQMKPHTLLPKGIEVRTPLAQTIEEATSNLHTLYIRLCEAMEAHGYGCSIISHHPEATAFQAPPNYKRHDYWQWALTATTTFGPDINIGLPESLEPRINLEDLAGKVNYYMTAASALSFASPLTEGSLWRIRGQVGKSIRTYRRSLWAPLHYVHEKPSLRFEFKGFEMSQDGSDYQAYFLMGLAMLLDESLKGRSSDQTRIYDLGALAVHGLADDEMKKRAAAVLESAEKTATKYGFATGCLANFWNRLDTGKLPSDRIVDIYNSERNINETLRLLSSMTHFPALANESRRELLV